MRRPGTGTLLIAAAVVGASCSEPSSVARHAASATIAPVLTDLLVAAVSGIAGGNGTMSNGLYTGVAPGSNLIGIGTGDVLFIFWALAGFDYILQHQDDYNIKVVNNSWGTSGPFDPKDPINVATKRVHNRGITVVFAAGNDGPDQNTLNPYSVAPWVIGVAASCSATDTLAQRVHCQPGGMLADFSSRGVPGDPLPPDKMRSILVQTADPMAGYAVFEVGAGLVNALKAVGRAH